MAISTPSFLVDKNRMLKGGIIVRECSPVIKNNIGRLRRGDDSRGRYPNHVGLDICHPFVLIIFFYISIHYFI